MSDENEEWVRIIVCLTCHKVKEAADWQGEPGADLTLEWALQDHRFANGDLHEIDHVYRVLAKDWNREEFRSGILKNIWGRHGYTGMEPWVYSNVNTLKSDAFQCWQSKLKPKRCADFHSESKRLTPPSQAERKDAEMKTLNVKEMPSSQVRYLCDYCVCRMQVENEVNLKNSNL